MVYIFIVLVIGVYLTINGDVICALQIFFFFGNT